MPDGLNSCSFIGNLGSAPEMRYTANGSATTGFRLAVNRSFAGKDGGERREETEWVQVVTWNKLAELCGQHLNKGRKVFVEGRLSTRSWEGPDGQRRYKTEVVANQVIFLDRRGEGQPVSDFDPDVYDIDSLPFDS